MPCTFVLPPAETIGIIATWAGGSLRTENRPISRVSAKFSLRYPG